MVIDRRRWQILATEDRREDDDYNCSDMVMNHGTVGNVTYSFRRSHTAIVLADRGRKYTYSMYPQHAVLRTLLQLRSAAVCISHDGLKHLLSIVVEFAHAERVIIG